MLRIATSRAAAPTSAHVCAPRMFMSRAFAATRYFTKSHEWLDLDAAAGTATIGLSNFAVKELNDITYIDLPAVDTTLEAEEDVCSIESVKAVVQLKAPVAGTISEVNTALEDTSNLGSLKDGGAEKEGGWIVKLKEVKADTTTLMSATEFEKFCDEESSE